MSRPLPLMVIGAASGALTALERSGALQALVDGPSSATALAGRLELDTRALGLVLEVLVELGLLDRDGDRYALGDELSHLVALPPEGLAGFWDQTEAFVRTGAPARPSDTEARNRNYPHVVEYLARKFEVPAAAFGDALAAELAPGARILDVGAGSGVWSLAIAGRLPDSRVTALDLPDVAPRFLTRARELGLGDRADAITGDYHQVPVPARAYDAIVVANVLHLETEDRAAALVERLAAALTPGGVFAVVDALGGGDASARRIHAAYALHLALRIDGGRPHPEADLRRWLTAAGLPHARRVDLGEDSLAALLAQAAQVAGP